MPSSCTPHQRVPREPKLGQAQLPEACVAMREQKYCLGSCGICGVEEKTVSLWLFIEQMDYIMRLFKNVSSCVKYHNLI